MINMVTVMSQIFSNSCSEATIVIHWINKGVIAFQNLENMQIISIGLHGAQCLFLI